MSSLRILHIHPRLIGSLAEWSGLNTRDKKSWLIQHTRHMGFNTLWFSPLFATSKTAINRHGESLSGSIYATRDHFTIDEDFSAAGDEKHPAHRRQIDDTHMRHFTRQAAAADIKVMGDLVFNHVAIDHPLVQEEDRFIADMRAHGVHLHPLYEQGSLVGVQYDKDNERDKTYYFKFTRNLHLSLAVPGANGETWEDVAQINYKSPEALSFFVEGRNGVKGYWKQVIDWHLDRGFSGFRCDVAYKIPAAVWSALAQYTHNRRPDAVFMAETLGDQGQADQLRHAEIIKDGKTQKAFDLTMLGTYWWNFRDQWLVDESHRMQDLSRYGGAGFPDNHDTNDTIAHHFLCCFNAAADAPRCHRQVANICARNYAVAALLCHSVYMQLGYEYCRDQISVFKDPARQTYWKDLVAERGQPDHPLNISSRIRAVNRFKDQIDATNALIDIRRISTVKDGLLKLEARMIDRDTNRARGDILIYLNEAPEHGAVTIAGHDIPDGYKSPHARSLIPSHGAGIAENMAAHAARDMAGDDCTVHDFAAFYMPEKPEIVRPAAVPRPVIPALGFNWGPNPLPA